MEQRTLYLAGGCFWGMEALCRALPGVLDTIVGYANGDRAENARYDIVCTGITGFRETVQVRYDPAVLSLMHLLFSFFAVIDPETPDRQGPDIGSQYQAGVYWTDPSDEAVIRSVFAVESAGRPCFAAKHGPLRHSYPAEKEHQRYLDRHPRGYCHIAPWRRSALARYPFVPAAYVHPAAELLEQWQAEQEEAGTIL